MIGIKIFHLIFKILLFFRYIALNYIKQMVKYQFGVNLVCCTDDNWTPSLQVQPAGSPCLHHAVFLRTNRMNGWGGQLIFFSIIAAQALKEDFPLSHVISPFTNQERREGMLLNLLIPFVLTVGSGSKGLINLTKINLLLLLCFLKYQAVVSSFPHGDHH